MSHTSKLLSAIGALTWAASTLASPAADTSADDPAQAKKVTQLGTVSVSAGDITKVDQTPISATTYDGEALRDRGIQSLEDIANNTPGVSFREDVAGRAGPGITIRGIGFDDYHAVGSPSVAVYVDGVYQGSNAWITGQLFDIGRVEILKGPQGTQYGQTTTTGAVNIVTNRPGDDAGNYVKLRYGSYDQKKIEAAYGMALNDKLSVRFAADRELGGGFLKSRGDASVAGTTTAPGKVPPLPLVHADDGFGDKDFTALRASLDYRASAATTLSLDANYARDKGANSQTSVTGTSATGFTQPDRDPYAFYANVLPFIDSTQRGLTLRLNHEFDDLLLTAVAGTQHMDRDYSLDPGSPLRAFDILYKDQLRQNTLDINLKNRRGGAVDWTLGAFYFQDRIDSRQLEDVSDFYKSIIDADALQHRRSRALYGDASWHFSERWTATAGLRYTANRASYRGATVDLNPYGVSTVASAFQLPVVFDNRYSDDNLSGRVGLSYEPSAASTFYGTASKGYKTGGFDGATIFTADKALPFKSESVMAYEAGYKWTPRDLPVHLTTAFYYDDFSNLQATAVKNIGGISTNVRTNVASARSYGAELQFGYTPTMHFELDGGLALNHSEITRVDSASAAEVARRLDKPLPDAPRLSYDLSAKYRFELGEGWALTPLLALQYTGSQYKEIDHYLRDGGYYLLDASVAILPPGGAWSVSFWGRNLTGSTYYVGLIPAATSAGQVTGAQRIVGAPRTVGVDFNIYF